MAEVRALLESSGSLHAFLTNATCDDYRGRCVHRVTAPLVVDDGKRLSLRSDGAVRAPPHPPQLAC